MTNEQISARSLEIAARIMVNAGFCTTDAPIKDCDNGRPTPDDCTRCIAQLLRKVAVKQLEREEKTCHAK